MDAPVQFVGCWYINPSTNEIGEVISELQYLDYYLVSSHLSDVEMKLVTLTEMRDQGWRFFRDSYNANRAWNTGALRCR